MEYRWLLVYDRYDGLAKKAANLLSGTVSGLLGYVLPVKPASQLTGEDMAAHDLICLGDSSNPVLRACIGEGLLTMPGKAEGYGILVGKNPLAPERQLVAVCGEDDAGLFYGCADFCGRYCGDLLYRDGYLWDRNHFNAPMERPLAPWSISAAPAIPTRAIWTWGHVIYDYRGFLENMAKLRLNEIVIWNDRAPLNADDVAEYAHSLGIKVIWGFAWGWDTGCKVELERLDDAALLRLRESVLETYDREYARAKGDGIYFQSFTELNEDAVGGKCIAEVVTDLVNDIAGALLEKYPQLHIQFGLHATSVKTHRDIIARTDPRVHIVWEDCGAFPWHYETDKTENFEETLAFTASLLTLRGENERFGAVLKGMMNLDWHAFEHFTAPYILGERTAAYIERRTGEKERLWKYVQAGWMKNLPLVQKTVSCIARGSASPIVEALVEDGMLESRIMLPTALYAALLWEPDRDITELLEETARSSFVD